MSVSNMKWFAGNLRRYVFVSPEALALKHQVQDWTGRGDWDEEEAKRLEKRFRALAQAGPVELSTGVYKGRRSGKKSGENVYSLQKLRSGMARGDIIPKERSAFYAPEQKQFVGQRQADETDDAAYWNDAVSASAKRVDDILQSAEKEFNQTLERGKKEEYASLYEWRNFRLYKAAASLWLLHTLVRIAPAWWEMISAIFRLVFAGEFGDIGPLLQELGSTLGGGPGDEAVTVLLTAGILLCIPVGLLICRQLIWEIWFPFYKLAARLAIRLSARGYRGRIRHLRKMLELLRVELQSAVQIRPGKRIDIDKLLWTAPRWIRTGDNPRFSFKSLLRFWVNFTVYPDTRPNGKSRSLGFFTVLLLVFYCFVLYVTVEEGAADAMIAVSRMMT